MQVQLRDIAEVVMGQSPPGDSCNSSQSGIPLLNGPTEFGSYHPVPVQYTTDPKKYSEVGDLLFCVRGSTTGRMNWSDQIYAIGRGLAAIRSRENKGFSSFIKSCIEVALPKLLMAATGSTFPSVSRDQLESISLRLPSDKEIEFIEDILGKLEVKIELNRKKNETLEEIAKVLFKSWFIDFDPVRTKAEGSSTGLPDEISELFPDSFDDSELGEIPSGWSTGTIKDLIEKSGMGPFGSRMKTKTFKKEGVPIIKGGNLKGMFVEGFGPDFLTEEHAVELKNSCVKAGDIVLTHRGTLGQVSMVPLDGKVDKYVASQSQFYLRPNTLHEGIYMLFFFHSREGRHRLLENSSSVGVPSLARPSTLTPQIKITIPEAIILDLFANQVIAMHRSIQIRLGEQSTLISLRDAILPKLISGELGVPDAEKMLEEVGI